MICYSFGPVRTQSPEKFYVEGNVRRCEPAQASYQAVLLV